MESMLTYFENEMHTLDKKAIVDKRIELVRLLDGDVFYSIRMWPRNIEETFWRKPIRDVEVLKLLLFFIGKGCPPTFISEWILLSQYWCFSREKCLKRARQIDFIVHNIDRNANKWYYFDMHVGRLLYINGTVKNNRQTKVNHGTYIFSRIYIIVYIFTVNNAMFSYK